MRALTCKLGKENSKEYRNGRCREQLLYLELSESKGKNRKLDIFISLEVVPEAHWTVKKLSEMPQTEAGKQTTYWDAC